MIYSPEEWFDQKIQELLKLFELKIPMELVSFPSSGITGALEYMERAPHKIGYKLQILNFKNVLLDTSGIEDKILDIERIATQNNLPSIIIIKTKDLNEFITEYPEIPMLLDKSRSKYRDLINYAYLTNKPLQNQQIIKSLDLFTYYINYFTDAIFEMFKSDFKTFGLTDMSDKDIQKVVNLTGGLMHLNRGYIRESLLTDTPILEIIQKNMSNPESFENLVLAKTELDKTTQNLDKSYRQVLTGENKNQKDIETLIKIGILNQNKECRSPILKKFFETHITEEPEPQKTTKSTTTIKTETNILNIEQGVTIDIHSMDVYLDGKVSDAYLTPNEFNVLNALVENRGKIVSRDDIAQILWGESYLLRYSDWAIDKNISKLRTKLGKNGHSIVKTRKKQGFIIPSPPPTEV